MNWTQYLFPGRDFFIPWRDRGGQLCPVRILTLLLLLLPALPLAFDAITGNLGPEPLEEATNVTGAWALRFLMLSLAVTPLGRALAWQKIYQVRRMMGLGAMAWVLAHVALYVVDQDAMWGKIVSEITMRFYLTIGFIAVLGMAVLSFTSSDLWVRRLGRGWKRLHRIVFVLTVLAVLHAVIQAKSNASEPLVMAGLLLWLVLWRAIPVEHAVKLWVMAALSIAADMATAGIEFLWYGNFTNLPAARIFAANFDMAVAPRPALLVALIPLGCVVLIALRRLAGRRLAA